MNKIYFLPILLSISCSHITKNDKGIIPKKIDMVFNKNYFDDSLLVYINDSLLINKIIKTDPSTGIAISHFYNATGKIKARIMLNSKNMFDSIISVKDMSSYIFNYDRVNDKMTMTFDKNIYVYE